MIYLNFYLPEMNFTSPRFCGPRVLMFTTPRQIWQGS